MVACSSKPAGGQRAGLQAVAVRRGCGGRGWHAAAARVCGLQHCPAVHDTRVGRRGPPGRSQLLCVLRVWPARGGCRRPPGRMCGGRHRSREGPDQQASSLFCRQALGGRAVLADVPCLRRPETLAKAAWKLAQAARHRSRVRPRACCAGRGVRDLGSDPSAANSLKLMGNLFIVSQIELAAECLALGEGHGRWQPPPRRRALCSCPLRSAGAAGVVGLRAGLPLPPTPPSLLPLQPPRRVCQRRRRLG